MKVFLIYLRVLRMLGPEARLAWLLACANLMLAGANFAEPVLLGRIIDALVNSQAKNALPSLPELFGLIGAWVGFGLFIIGCSTYVALHADRLSHRRRHAVLTSYFEHVLQLPLSFHGGSHSGRLMKVMLAGTDALWSLWLDFFRDSFVGAASVVFLIPLALWFNWRLGLLLVGACIVFGMLTALVVRKTSSGQNSVEQH